jgi:hypothetical protein
VAIAELTAKQIFFSLLNCALLFQMRFALIWNRMAGKQAKILTGDAQHTLLTYASYTLHPIPQYDDRAVVGQGWPARRRDRELDLADGPRCQRRPRSDGRPARGGSGRCTGEDLNRRNAIFESVVNLLLCHADAMQINPFCMAHLLACHL